MAQVDFSHAKLEPKSTGERPITYSDIMRLNYSNYIYDSSGNIIASNVTKTILSETNSKVSILYVGQFTASGTECYPSAYNWRISNISFSAGDTFSFVIDVEVTVGT